MYFGQSDPPSSAATGQPAESYNPGTLAYSTVYYWKIVAEDPDGETSSSAVWSFTTMAQPSETVSTPNTPTGPATGDTSENLGFNTGGATSSEGHTVQYRFDWDDGNISSWATGRTHYHTWASVGTYAVKAQARCRDHTNVESAWSDAVSVDITAAPETISRPGGARGPVAGPIGNTYDYEAYFGSTSSFGHDVEYRFDWDDGSFSGWVGSQERTYHAWSEYGTYGIKAQGRCIADTLVVSDWSAPRNLLVQEIISVPDKPSGPTSGVVGATLTYTTGGSYSSDGHALEYRIRFYKSGVDVYSDWSATPSFEHVFATAGTHYVYARARCVIHPEADSNWSSYLSVTISEP